MKGIETCFAEIAERVRALEARYLEVRAAGDALIERVRRESYYDTDRSGYMTLRWRSCGSEECKWCPDGHGPYWAYARYYHKTGNTRSVHVQGITHRELLRVVGHTRGYHELKALDDERKKIVRDLKALKDAYVAIKRILEKVEA